jgi:hypothetical protein
MQYKSRPRASQTVGSTELADDRMRVLNSLSYRDERQVHVMPVLFQDIGGGGGTFVCEHTEQEALYHKIPCTVQQCRS